MWFGVNVFLYSQEFDLEGLPCLETIEIRQPTPVFLPGESQGRGSLVGCRLPTEEEEGVQEDGLAWGFRAGAPTGVPLSLHR